MKYLAAYALLVLGGKANPSNQSITQLLMMSKPCWRMLMLKLMKPHSRLSLHHWMENHFTSWLPVESRRLDLPLSQLVKLPRPRRMTRNKLLKRTKRNKLIKKLRSQLKKRLHQLMMMISWEEDYSETISDSHI